MRVAMSDNRTSDKMFLSLLEEAKILYTKKSKENQAVLKQNEDFKAEIVQLKSDEERHKSSEASLVSKIKVLEEKLDKAEKDVENVTAHLAKSKDFMKDFFTNLRGRITEVEEKGIYNAETFGYLIGDVGRSLCNTSFAASPQKSPVKKARIKLSTNKEKKRTYIPSTVQLTSTNKTNLRPKEDKQTEEDNTTTRLENTNAKKESFTTTNKKNHHVPHINIVNYPASIFLDPDSTLRSPIGPPSHASTPHEPLGNSPTVKEPQVVGEEQETDVPSPSLLPQDYEEDPKSPLLSHVLMLEDDEILEITEPQSPTIPSRSHSGLSKEMKSDVLPKDRKRKRSLDAVSFGSLLNEPQLFRPTSPVGDGRNGVTTAHEQDNLDVQPKPSVSPDLIIIEDNNFVRPDPASSSISRRNTRTCPRNNTKSETSSLLLFSPQHGSSPVTPHKGSRCSSNDHEIHAKEEHLSAKNECADNESKLVFHLNLDESVAEKNMPERNNDENDKAAAFKYVEVVRGKDKRAKLNGYFCADCEKYYGSLKLSEEEMRERLKDCSRHRAQFSPPPSTPEHFWQVGFMDTNEYMAKGYLRSESQLPIEKRKLKSRRTKGKLLKFNNNNNSNNLA